MNDKREPIEGELAQKPADSRQVAPADPRSVQVFNPLDAEPLTFKKQLVSRQENYDALQMHLRGVLIPGKDFGKIHIAKNCSNKRTCQNPAHLSDWSLFAAGADKIATILGLGVHYPDLKDYKRAALKGYPIEDILLDCQIVDHNDVVISEGVGACSRDEFNTRSLNSTIKRASKRARVDAVRRLPAVSALFEDDFLDSLAKQAESGPVNSSADRSQSTTKNWDTGAKLEVCPIGPDTKGRPWRELDTPFLEWIVAKVTDKPDVLRAASAELERRSSSTASGPSSIRTPASPASQPDGSPEYTDEDISQ